ATTISQSSLLALGINWRNSSIRCSFDNITCCIRYLVNVISLATAANIVNRLSGLIEVNKSNMEPFFNSLCQKTAKGPNSNDFLLSLYRVSRWGTDMGEAPTLALP